MQAHVTFDIPTTDPGYQSATGTFVIETTASIEELIDVDSCCSARRWPNTLAVGDNAVIPIMVEGGSTFLSDDVGSNT